MTLLNFLEVFSILVNATSGFIEARNRKMDTVGFFIVAFVTAFGGGTLRDILLDRRPLFWVDHQEYTVLIFALALVARPLLNTLEKLLSERLLVIADAIGLGMLSIAGISVALAAGMPPFIAAIMGVITGTFGGVLRDIVCNEVPMLLQDRMPYATCSLLGCGLFLLMRKTGAPADFTLWFSALAITAMRLVTWARDIRIR
ncbi:Uncharacterized membrane protein YeiH [Noviherbaspirillum humi]|uniref:Uncharacterized membrane protein YeiH n=1 Tax=Noviherbaspirillum humi TaxID=1688639 RepID=A0A239GVM5_9BURK|nr:trimeric intracellular cation channel family protein [Noviherbaspirillum humi]SNS72573.1 Uncharacterized membrane protein YeiH [Noviherbaspirillum humi]